MEFVLTHDVYPLPMKGLMIDSYTVKFTVSYPAIYMLFTAFLRLTAATSSKNMNESPFTAPAPPVPSA